MSGINRAGATSNMRGHNDHFRRHGTEGHQGKHLGQFKHGYTQTNNANLPLIQQQLSALALNANTGSDTTATQANANQQSTLYDQLYLDALRSTGANVSDQMNFVSRFNAMTTAF